MSHYSARENRFTTPIIVLLSILTLIFGLEMVRRYSAGKRQLSVYDKPLIPAPNTENPLAGIDEQFHVDENFKTHLPLIIIDTGGVEPEPGTVYDTEYFEKYGLDRRIRIAGMERYVSGTIRLINTGGMNGIYDEPEAESLIQIRRRGNSSIVYEKAQYLIRLVTESGERNKLDFLNMGADWEWVLNGSMADKSMFRNYLPYRIISSIMPFTPESVYCEVLFKEGDNYRYDGVHMLIESIRQGPHRVDIPRYVISDPYPSYIVRRDRERVGAITLDTYLTSTGASDRDENNMKFIALRYPGINSVTQKTVDYIKNDINRIETVLYSDNPSVFKTYPRYIDVNSFVDYFIVNEFFGNYDAGQHSTYMYKNSRGKFKMGPVWDFDDGLDNYKFQPMEVEHTAFQERPLFERLVLDMTFVKKLQKRYNELRMGPLSNFNIRQMVDEINNHLGPAIDREWYRWASIYLTYNARVSMIDYVDDDELLLHRNLMEQRLESYRTTTYILEHAAHLKERFLLFEWNTRFVSGVPGLMNIILLLIFMLFFIPLGYISRR